MSKREALVLTVWENPGIKRSAPVRPPLRVVERKGGIVVSLFQEEVALSVGELLNGNREVVLFVQSIVAQGFRRQDLSRLYPKMDGVGAWILNPDEEDSQAAHAFEGHLQRIAGAWFVEVPGFKPYKLTPSDTIYVAPVASFW